MRLGGSCPWNAPSSCMISRYMISSPTILIPLTNQSTYKACKCWRDLSMISIRFAFGKRAKPSYYWSAAPPSFNSSTSCRVPNTFWFSSKKILRLNPTHLQTSSSSIARLFFLDKVTIVRLFVQPNWHFADNQYNSHLYQLHLFYVMLIYTLANEPWQLSSNSRLEKQLFTSAGKELKSFEVDKH